MPVTYVYTENTIAEWRTYFNIMGANVGDLERLDLPYPSNVDLVTAINALYSGAMVPVGLLTNNNISIVGAVNELWSNIGPLPNLITPNKANIVAAINDVWTKANSGVFDGNVVIHGNLHVDYGIRANGNIDGYSDFNLFGNARVNGDLRVNGDYIFLNSNNIYMMDPILRVGTAEDGADYPGDDQRDRGISFGYFDAGLPRSGFFGFDRNKKAYYFLNDAYETDGYVILGNLANLNADYLDGQHAAAFATVASGSPAYAANRLNGSAGLNVLRFVQGTLTGSATAGFSGTNKPGSTSSNVWIQIDIDGTTLYIPAWT